jgi:hypothetical protein
MSKDRRLLAWLAILLSLLFGAPTVCGTGFLIMAGGVSFFSSTGTWGLTDTFLFTCLSCIFIFAIVINLILIAWGMLTLLWGESNAIENTTQYPNRRKFVLPTTILFFCLLMFGCCCLILGTFSGIAIYRKESSYDTNRYQDQRSNVWIIWQMDQDMFPYEVKAPPINLQAVALKPQEAERSKSIIKKGLDKYPAALLRKTLQKVYIENSVSMGGMKVGGTYCYKPGQSFIYLANEGINVGYTDFFIERALHEEYSSILLRTYPNIWSDKDWEQANPKGFKYRYEVSEGYKTIGNIEYDPSLYAEGFINQYSETLLENDFNAIASRLLVGDAQLWQIARQYRAIKIKVDLVINFYHQIDPQFTEDYFLSLL